MELWENGAYLIAATVVRVRLIYLNREEVGEYYTILDNIKNDDENFCNYARMSYTSFTELLSLVQGRIYHPSLNYREAICPEQRLFVTLSSVDICVHVRSVRFLSLYLLSFFLYKKSFSLTNLMRVIVWSSDPPSSSEYKVA